MSVLIKNQTELKAALAVSVGLDLSVLTPYLSKSFAEKEVVKVLGQTTYETLLQNYNDETLTAAQIELVPFVQKPLANLAVWDWVQVGQVSVGSAGVQILGSKDKVAFRYQSEAFMRAILRHGYDALEDLISYMEDNATDFPDWKTDSEYAQLTQFFINRVDEFQQYVNINSSRRLLVSMWPLMKFIEDTVISPLLTSDLFSALKTAIKAGSLTSEQSDLVRKVQPVIAHLTIAEAITQLSLSLTDEGAFVQYTNSGSGDVTGAGQNSASDARLSRFETSHKGKGESYLEQLRVFLNDNASDTMYTEYFNSSNYTSPDDFISGYEQDSETNTYNAL